jgi:hypothetical protein
MSTVQGGQGNIVTNGLVLNLDAANPRSYAPPFNGTTWQNIAPVSSSLTGSLINGVGYTGSNGGALVFDGVDDYAIGNGIFVTTEATLIVWFKTSNTYGNNYLLSLPWISTNNNGFDLGFGGSTTFRGIVVTTSGFKELNYTTTYSNNNWHMAAMTYSASNAVLYYDGVARTTDTSLSGSLRQTTNGEFNIARFGSFGAHVAANISLAQVYNRALNASEVLQNFNATRARFGV